MRVLVLTPALVLLGVFLFPFFRCAQTQGPKPSSSKQAAARPSWLNDGVVATGSVEPLLFVIRRGGGAATVLERREADLNEETIKKWKEAGCNLIIRNLYKGAGLQAEAADIEAARKFSQLAHRHGIKVGGYVGSSLLYETLFLEEPGARDWKQVDEWGRPIYYTQDQTFRYMACRNNPGYMAHIRKVLRLGVEDVKFDLIHFDQLRWPEEPRTCRCKYCAEEFRKFLRNRYTDPQLKLRFGFVTLAGIIPPPYNLLDPPIRLEELRNPLMQEWACFRATSLAQRWRELVGYIRELNPEVAVQGNATMYLHTNAGFSHGVDPSLLFDHGDYLRTEERNQAEWTADGRLISLIRPYKAARVMGKAMHVWQASKSPMDWQARSRPEKWQSPVELRLAEAMAYNDMMLGSFRNLGDVTAGARRYISFFHAHKAELRNTVSVADVAILRSFPSIEFNPAESLFSTVLFEQSLIQGKIPFHIIFDRHLKDLGKYKVLVLANQDALSDEQLHQIRSFVEKGGGLVATEQTSLLTDWRRRRLKFGLTDLFGIDQPPSPKEASQSLHREHGKGRVVYVPRIEAAVKAPPAQMNYDVDNKYWKLPKNHRELLDAVRWAAGGELAAELEAPDWVTMELARQRDTNLLLLHLVNYKTSEPVADIGVRVRIPRGMKVRDAVMETPDGGGRQSLDVAMQGQTATFRVPQLKTYDLILLQLEKA